MIGSFDLIAVVVASLSGALVAARKEMDFYGYLLLGVITAIGGGTLRDLLIGADVFWVADQRYLIAGLLGAPIAYLFAREALKGWRRRAIFLLDTCAMGMFTATGSLKALEYGASPLVSIAMGLCTATIGGVMRDVIAQELPFVFRGEIYAFAAIIGATTSVTLFLSFDNGILSLLSGIFVAICVRIGSYQLGWRLNVGKRVTDDD